jgi:hypothetical protein
MKVSIITTQQKDSLIGQLVEPDWYFNPVLDCNDNLIISSQEIDGSIYPQNDWVKTLPLIDWCGPYIPPSGTTQSYSGI